MASNILPPSLDTSLFDICAPLSLIIARQRAWQRSVNLNLTHWRMTIFCHHHFDQVFLILVLIFIGNCTTTYLASLSEPQSDALAHNNILPPSLYAGLFDIGAHIDAQAHNNVLGSAE